MSNVQNYEITSEHGKKLLKQIEDELSRIISHDQKSHENREYKPNELLNEMVRALLKDLQLSVRDNTIILRIIIDTQS